MPSTDVYTSGPGVGAAMAKERRQRRFASLQFAVSDVVDELTADEAYQLRVNGVLPSNFVAKVVRRARDIESGLDW